ncbi:MAG: hypothetical protein Kow00107_02070 [Planctomycetota bacterium]
MKRKADRAHGQDSQWDHGPTPFEDYLPCSQGITGRFRRFGEGNTGGGHSDDPARDKRKNVELQDVSP